MFLTIYYWLLPSSLLVMSNRRKPFRVTTNITVINSCYIDLQLAGMVLSNKYSSFELEPFRYMLNVIILMPLEAALASKRYASLRQPGELRLGSVIAL